VAGAPSDEDRLRTCEDFLYLIKSGHLRRIGPPTPLGYAFGVSELRVEVSEEVAERLASEAAERGTSAEDVAADLITTHVPPVRAWNGRPRFVGQGHSGRHDLSERVEELLDAELGA